MRPAPAVHDQLPSRVALKVIHAGTSEALLERFGRERRILAGLIHPYIARLLDTGKLDDGQPYFGMQYVEGQTINDYAALHPSEVIELFLKLCSAVQFARQNLVIHRDLKPSNILRQPRPHLLTQRLAIQALAR